VHEIEIVDLQAPVEVTPQKNGNAFDYDTDEVNCTNDSGQRRSPNFQMLESPSFGAGYREPIV